MRGQDYSRVRKLMDDNFGKTNFTKLTRDELEKFVTILEKEFKDAGTEPQEHSGV